LRTDFKAKFGHHFCGRPIYRGAADDWADIDHGCLLPGDTGEFGSRFVESWRMILRSLKYECVFLNKITNQRGRPRQAAHTFPRLRAMEKNHHDRTHLRI
jgi:hypothetical protein